MMQPRDAHLDHNDDDDESDCAAAAARLFDYHHAASDYDDNIDTGSGVPYSSPRFETRQQQQHVHPLLRPENKFKFQA